MRLPVIQGVGLGEGEGVHVEVGGAGVSVGGARGEGVALGVSVVGITWVGVGDRVTPGMHPARIKAKMVRLIARM
jgi:hypothetical protein